jgi:hypothetical protein
MTPSSLDRGSPSERRYLDLLAEFAGAYRTMSDSSRDYTQAVSDLCRGTERDHLAVLNRVGGDFEAARAAVLATAAKLHQVTIDRIISFPSWIPQEPTLPCPKLTRTACRASGAE